ncbi:MAG: histidine ammonia-lyase [Armatimonadetes bacterium]|nr:histidine ammonia-lyase [Armatimonadota bacterium]
MLVKKVLAEVGDVVLDGEHLTLSQIEAVCRSRAKVSIAGGMKERLLASRNVVQKALEREEVVYGITTGFGKFSEVFISSEDRLQLQRNLILSHAGGVGEPFPREVVRGIILLRINALLRGFSGVRLELVNLLVGMLNADICPLIPCQGSVGASGDLAPLAHLGLTVIGEGEVLHNGVGIPAKNALESAGLTPLVLEAKEGLALVNGTCAMASMAVLALQDAVKLAKTADIAGAMSLEALMGTDRFLHPLVQVARPFPGQSATAENLTRMVRGSKLIETHRKCQKVQDAYSLRCMPQVHGTVKETIRQVRSVLEVEVNAATDNPLIFPEEELIISAGNFHGQPLSMACDILKIGLTILSNISERRVDRLMNPDLSGLPAFLAEKGGMNSGLMLAQYTAASLVAENKILASPSSVDSIPTSAQQEDFVSMGTTAARHARQVVKNLESVLAIEILAAAQGLDFRRPSSFGPGTEAAHRTVREAVPHLKEDRIVALDIEKVGKVIRSGALVRSVESVTGPLEVS